jgi:hypothetical protein
LRENSCTQKLDQGLTLKQHCNSSDETYYYQVLGSGTPNTQFDDLERQWLLKEIADRGGTPAGVKRSELWKQLVAVIGGTPVNEMDQNRLIFFATAS